MSDLASEISAAVDAQISTPVESAPSSAEPTSTPTTGVPSSPASAAPGAAPTRSAQTPATTPAAEPVDPEPTGPIPLDRHRTILANARVKATEAVTQELTQTYGYDKERWQVLRPHVDQLVSDPVAFYQKLGAELAQRGVLPQSSQPSQPSVPTPQPQTQPTDLNTLFRSDPARFLRQAEDGSIVPTAEGLIAMDAWQRAQLHTELEKRFAPMEALRKQAEMASAQQQGQTMALQTITTCRQQSGPGQVWEGFTELEADIKALMLRDGRTTLESAYHRVYREKYAPSIREKERASLLAEIKQRPTQHADIAPGAARSASRSKHGSAPDVWDAALADTMTKLQAAH